MTKHQILATLDEQYKNAEKIYRDPKVSRTEQDAALRRMIHAAAAALDMGEELPSQQKYRGKP